MNESFLLVPDRAFSLSTDIAGGFLNRPLTGGRPWLGRAATVLGPLGDATDSDGFSGLGVLERRIVMPDGDTILLFALALRPILEGVRMSVLGVPPALAALSIGGKVDLKRVLFEISCPGPELEPGLLHDCGIGGG